MISQDSPIGVFDSGAGGLSVLIELAKLMPHEDYIYYGDSLNAPYGTKTLEEVRALTENCVKKLREDKVKQIVIACNTATSAAAKQLRNTYTDMSIVGIEPALKPAAEENEGRRILVMATPLTLREEKFKKLLACYKDRAEIKPLPCPGLVELIEEGKLWGEELEEYLGEKFKPYMDGNTAAAVLGCTHYPLVKSTISKIFGDKISIYDGGCGTAHQSQRLLAQNNMLKSQDDTSEHGKIIFTSSEPGKEKFYEEIFKKAVRS